MSKTFDVCLPAEPISKIKFVDEAIALTATIVGKQRRVDACYLVELERHVDNEAVVFIDNDGIRSSGAKLLNKQHGLYCIAAIQKAIELGWLK